MENISSSAAAKNTVKTHENIMGKSLAARSVSKGDI